MQKLLVSLGATICAGFLGLNAHGAEVRVFDMEGAIGPAISEFFVRSLNEAEEDGVELFVIRMDTPGGLDSAMREIVSAILASNVPVATFVSPAGARAASAGTYVTYASHIAAMAPTTNIGSSTPVSIGGGGSPVPTPRSPISPPEEGDGGNEEEAREAPSSAMERKVVNDAVAYIKGLAELRGRNSEWAEETVLEAANLTATAALENGVIDYVADDLNDLLRQLDGQVIANVNAAEVTLQTADVVVDTIESDWRHKFLQVITNPNVAYLILMLGIYALISEFSSPGIGAGGIVGIICVLLAAYALQMLPVNYVGLALLAVGIGLLIAEVFTPTYGVLAVGGVAAFALGSIMLIDAEVEGFGISLEIVFGLTVTTGLLVFFGLGTAIKARRAEVVSGAEAMIGSTGIVVGTVADVEADYRIRVAGELWNAKFDGELAEGTAVRIKSVDDLKLTIAKEDEDR